MKNKFHRVYFFFITGALGARFKQRGPNIFHRSGLSHICWTVCKSYLKRIAAIFFLLSILLHIQLSSVIPRTEPLPRFPSPIPPHPLSPCTDVNEALHRDRFIGSRNPEEVIPGPFHASSQNDVAVKEMRETQPQDFHRQMFPDARMERVRCVRRSESENILQQFRVLVETIHLEHVWVGENLFVPLCPVDVSVEEVLFANLEEATLRFENEIFCCDTEHTLGGWMQSDHL